MRRSFPVVIAMLLSAAAFCSAAPPPAHGQIILRRLGHPSGSIDAVYAPVRLFIQVDSAIPVDSVSVGEDVLRQTLQDVILKGSTVAEPAGAVHEDARPASGGQFARDIVVERSGGTLTVNLFGRRYPVRFDPAGAPAMDIRVRRKAAPSQAGDSLEVVAFQWGTVTWDAGADRMDVYVDGASQGTTPVTLPVRPGQRRFEWRQRAATVCAVTETITPNVRRRYRCDRNGVVQEF